MEQFSEPIIYFAPTNGKLKLAPHGFYASAPADAKSNQLKSIQNRINGERQYVSLMGLLLKKFRGLLSKNNFRGLLSKNNIGKISCQYFDEEFLISLFCKRGPTNFHRFFQHFQQKIPKKYSHLRYKYICPSTLFFCVEFDRLQSFRSCQCETCEKERHFHRLLYKLAQ